MERKSRKKNITRGLVAITNIGLILSVILSVFSAFQNDEKISFKQNIENVRTLSNAYASKVELELVHYTQEIENVAYYINQNNLDEEQIISFLKEFYVLEDRVARWQIVDSKLINQNTSDEGFSAISVDTSDEFVYRGRGYEELAQIFVAPSKNVGKVQYTSEFTTPSSDLKKCFAFTTPILIHKDQQEEYKTLMLLIKSEDMNELISNNNDDDILQYYDYSNIIIDNDGNYVISNRYFQGTNFLDYIALYNESFSENEKEELSDKLKKEDYFEVLYYKNNKEFDCVYTIVPVQNSNWHMLSIVPISSFHHAYNFGGNILNFAISFTLLFMFDIVYILLTNKRLRMKTKEAEAANQAKSVFLSSMSHDIRTPMNAIVGMTLIAGRQLDEKTVDIESVKECINSIQLAGNHLMTLINDILDISKIESGINLLHTDEFSLPELFVQLIEISQADIKNKKFDFEAHMIHLEHELILGDHLRVNQVFINILSNAIKYTESKGKIEVSLEEVPCPNKLKTARYVYRVKDNGIGMSEEFVSTIFERFSRAVDTRINSVQGTGLGMAIVKQLVDAMQGEIVVNSKLNEGTEFIVTLDFPVGSPIEKVELSPNKVLILDSSPLDTSMIQSTLDYCGMQIRVMDKSISELEKEDIGDVQLIFVDEKMVNGNQSINNLKKFTHGGKVIVLSSEIANNPTKHAQLKEADYILEKPLYPSRLVACTKSVQSGKNLMERISNETFEKIEVLVAEDNDTNWLVLEKILHFYNIKCSRVNNGLEAVKWIKEEKTEPDLILMDIQMPLMNGYEATKEIRKLKDNKLASIPIYAMTADAFTDDIKKSEEAGMNGHCAKPIDINRLLDIIRKVYKNKIKS